MRLANGDPPRLPDFALYRSEARIFPPCQVSSASTAPVSGGGVLRPSRGCGSGCHAPCGLVRDAELALNLLGRDPHRVLAMRYIA